MELSEKEQVCEAEIVTRQGQIIITTTNSILKKKKKKEKKKKKKRKKDEDYDNIESNHSS